MTYLAVAVGGAVGAMMRYALTGALQAWSGWPFPIGTLTVNVVGSLAIGLVLHFGGERPVLSAEMRLLLTTGLCGGLTTFSTFSYETQMLLAAERWDAAAGNVLLNVVLCGAAAWLGIQLGRAL